MELHYEGAKTFAIAALSALVIFFLVLIDFEKDRLNTENNLLKNSLDTLTKTKNKDGSETAKIALLENDTRTFLALKTMDSSIKSLQQEVSKYKSLLDKNGSVTVFSTTTIYNAGSRTSVSGTTLNPIYTAYSKDSLWIKWKTIASKDSTHLDLFIKNAYSVVIGQERYGFLRLKTKPIVQVTNKNPYTTTDAIRAYRVSVKPHKFGLGIHLGYGISTKGVAPYLGIGLHYNLISF